MNSRRQRPEEAAGEGGGESGLDLAEEELPPGQQCRGRRKGSERPLKLIGAENLERRQAGQQKQRYGDEAAAPSQGVDKAGDPPAPGCQKGIEAIVRNPNRQNPR